MNYRDDGAEMKI